MIESANSYTYLGVKINVDGTFTGGIKDLVSRARRAYHSWSYKFNQYVGTPVRVLVKLYNTTVKPVMLYGSEIWGAYYKDIMNNDIPRISLNNNLPFEKLNNRFCHHTLGVSKNTSNLGCKAELGFYPLIVNILENIILYYKRITQMEKCTLVSKALQTQYNMFALEINQKCKKFSFLHAVYAFSKYTKMYNLELNEAKNKASDKSKKIMKKNIKE